MTPIRITELSLLIALLTISQPALSQSPAPTDDFDRYILEQMEEVGIPGATVVVSHRGEILKSRGYGLANVEWEVPASPETVYEIASVNKLFTALAAMILVEEGALDLDAPITRYIEGVPESHGRITARHLLTHTAGLVPDHYDSFKLFAPIMLRYTSSAQLADLFAKPLESEPGVAHQYGGSNMFLLGVVIARISGMPYEEFMRQRIFEPAGMVHTSFIDASAVVPQRAQEYTLRGGKLVRWSIEQNLQALDGNASAGMLSTATDLQRFTEALRTDRLIAAETQRAMLEPHRLPDGSYGEGSISQIALGWWVQEDMAGQRCASHVGHTGSAFHYFPDAGFVVIFLSNLTKGYDFMGDQGVEASVRHSIAERAVEVFLNTE